MTPCRLAAALLTAAAAAAPAAANFYYYYRMGECGELASLCCVGDGGFECDDGLVCDTNVQALLSPGFCVECGALDELPCSDGSCDEGLEDVDGVCVDPGAPPPPPCGATGQPCCSGVNIPFDSDGCDPDNNCDYVEEGQIDLGLCTPCGFAGEKCCTILNDDIISVECAVGECGPINVCEQGPERPPMPMPAPMPGPMPGPIPGSMPGPIPGPM